MAPTPSALRAALVQVMLGMGEIHQPQADALLADGDMDLSQLNFDSLTMLDFCLQVETKTGLIINPDELLELPSFNTLEAALLKRQAPS